MSLAEEIDYSEDVSRVTKVKFGIASPRRILEQSVCEIYNHIVSPTPGSSQIGTLNDPRMGTSDRSQINALSHLPLMYDPGHFGHINFAKPVILYQYFAQVVDTLNCVCAKCSALLIDKTDQSKNSTIRILQGLKGRARFQKVLADTKKVKNCYNCGACKVEFKKDKEGIAKVVGKNFTFKFESNMKNCVKQAGDGTDIDPNSFRFVDPEVCLFILKNITDEDCQLMGYNVELTRPDWMIWTQMPVPPPSMRPDVQNESNITQSDDLTHKLNDIIKTNNYIRNLMTSNEADKNKYIPTWWQLLQYHVATYIDNENASIPKAVNRSGRPYKTIRQRIKAKEGRVRGNLMGKRVNHSARSVITPDPNISIDELGVPLEIATNLTYPEYVNDYNIKELTQLVRNGPVWPGAKCIKYADNNVSPINQPLGKCQKKFRCRLKYLDQERRNRIVLQPGDKVYRHLIDGDIVLFNRQPSLHKMSMMGHRAKVMKKGSSFRLNISVTTPYNADFDGDEMNMHCTLSCPSIVEVRDLAGVPHQIVSPQASRPVMGLVQDSLLASYLFPKLNRDLSVSDYMKLVGWTNSYQGNLLPNANTDDPTNNEFSINSFPTWKPNDVFSSFLPKESYQNKETNLLIENGNMINKGPKPGYFDKSSMGAKAGSLIHNVWNDFGPETTRHLFDNMMNITTQWLLINGFSVGLRDTFIEPDQHQDVTDKVNIKLAEAKLKIDYLHQGRYPILTDEEKTAFKQDLIREIGYDSPTYNQDQRDAVTNKIIFLDTGKKPYVQFEMDISQVLNEARSVAEKTTYTFLNDQKNPDGSAYVNRMNSMVASGSKGSKTNLVQIISLLGQQEIEGSRIIRGGYRGRVLPHFYKDNITPEAAGFVGNGFLKGLNPTEYWYHAMAGRIGVISTSIKTAETGYLQRKLIKAMEDAHVTYDNTVRNANDMILQFNYGQDGFDASRIEPQKFDYLKISNQDFQTIYQYLPTDFNNDFGLYLTPNAYQEMTQDGNDWQDLLANEFQTIAEDRRLLKFNIFKEEIPNKIYSPVNFYRLFDTMKYRFGLNNKPLADVSPVYVITTVDMFLREVIETYNEFNVNPETGLPRNPENLAVLLALFRSYLASKKIVKAKFNREAFDFMIGECRRKFHSALITPGENVGVIAAQSIGEPSTQMTLDVFHSTGVGSKANVSRGIPRMIEILRVAQTLKTPSLTVSLNQQYLRKDNTKGTNKNIEQDKVSSYQNAKKIASELEYTVLGKLIAKTEIIYDKHDCPTIITEDQAFINAYYEFQGPACQPEQGNPWLLRIEFRKDALANKNITLLDVQNAIQNVYDESQINCIFSDDNSENLICRIRCQDIVNRKFDPSQDLCQSTTLNPEMLMEELQSSLMNIRVKGIIGINIATVRLIEPYEILNVDGTYSTSYNYVVDTDGVNLIKVFNILNVDYANTYSNHIVEVLEILGIEAARELIIQELNEVMEFAGTYINPRHIELLADIMTNQGYLVSVDRHGAHKTDSGPLARASFEETTLQIFNASIFGEEDPMTGTSANIMFGQCILTGTNAFDITLDENMIENTIFPKEKEKKIPELPIQQDTSSIINLNTTDYMIYQI